MPLERPTITQLVDRIQADLAARIPGSDPRIRRSMLDVLARSLAGFVHGAYGFAASVAADLFPDTATSASLDRLAAIWGVARGEAAYSFGDATTTGTNGVVVPAGTVLVRGDGLQYTTQAAGTIASGTVTVPIRSVDASEAANAVASTPLYLQSPQGGVNSPMTVAAGGLVGGADQESDDSLRSSLIARISAPPQGGSRVDFERWTFEAEAAVTRRWVFDPASTSGLVTVSIICDEQSPITATAGQIAAVQAYLDARRPLGSRVSVGTPTLSNLNLTITGLSPDTTEVRAAIAAELRDMLIRDASPGGTVLVSRIREAISVAAGESDHSLTTPSANVSHSAGVLPVLGTITYA